MNLTTIGDAESTGALGATHKGPPAITSWLSEMERVSPQHRNRARRWVWRQDTEPAMKLTLLAICRGAWNEPELLDATGLASHSLARTWEKLADRGLLEAVAIVLSTGRRPT